MLALRPAALTLYSLVYSEVIDTTVRRWNTLDIDFTTEEPKDPVQLADDIKVAMSADMDLVYIRLYASSAYTLWHLDVGFIAKPTIDPQFWGAILPFLGTWVPRILVGIGAFEVVGWLFGSGGDGVGGMLDAVVALVPLMILMVVMNMMSSTMQQMQPAKR